MFSYITPFTMGMLISFLGSLPLGTLNISATQLAVGEGSRKAVAFAIGVALVEIIYVRLSLVGIDWIVQHRNVFIFMEWLTVLLFVVLAFSSFRAATHKQPDSKNILLNNRIRRFWLGVTMSAVNPVQIPFWFLWSSYLISNRLLAANELSFHLYIAGIACGTVAALFVFIYGGRWLVQKFNASYRSINWVVGVVFLVSAAIQLIRVLNKPFNLPAN